jgi:hypothetical protein
MNANPGNVLTETDRPAGSAFPAASGVKSNLLTILLQASHRLGSVALLATIGAWATMYMIKDFHLPLAIAAGTANLGLCAALVARMMTVVSTPLRRETNGVAIFNLVLLILALQLMVFARLDVIRSAASQFFTPSPHTALHG